MERLYYLLCGPGNITEEGIEKLQDAAHEDDCHKIPSSEDDMAVGTMTTQQL